MPLLNINERQAMAKIYQDLDVSPVDRHIGSGSRPAKVTSVNYNARHGSETGPWIRFEDFSAFKNSVENPRWREQILKAQDATTPFSAEHHFVAAAANATAGYHWLQQTKDQVYVSLDPVSYVGHTTCPFPDQSRVPTMRTLAASKFYNKMSDSFAGGTFIGELRETVAMIRRPALELRRGLNHLIRTNVGIRNRTLREFKRNKINAKQARKQYAKAAAASWLEWRFGMIPLMSDISSAYEAFQKLSATPLTEPFHFAASERSTSSKHVKRVYTAFFLSADMDIAAFHEVGVKYTGAVLSRVSTSASIQESLSVAPLDWVPTSWQLLPYSWIADYFFNIGEVLDAIVLAQRIRYAYCCENVRHLSKYRVDVAWRFDGAGAVEGVHYENLRIGDAGFARAQKKRVVRTKVATVPIPSLSTRWALSTSRGMNLAALGYLKNEALVFRNRHRI